VPHSVVSFELADDHVTAIRMVVNPEKLARI
jgi:hypothetical protein